MDEGNFGCAADVGFCVSVNNLSCRCLQLSGDVEDVSGCEKNRVLMPTAFAAFPALESELRIQVHQLPLDFFHLTLFR